MAKIALVVSVLSFAVSPAYACGMGGIGGTTSGAVIALCVLFLPVIIPVAAVGGTGYVAYKGLKKGTQLTKRAIYSIDKNKYRKRNSDIIKTQMSRAVKIVGRSTFNDYIQTLFDNIKANNTAYNNFELGIALFLNKDLIGAEEYLTKSIELARAFYTNPGVNPDGPRTEAEKEVSHFGHAFFIRGLTNQYLWDFDQAADDFKEAIRIFEEDPSQTAASGSAEVPMLTSLDAHNSYGFACALKALYGSKDDAGAGGMDVVSDEERVELLDIAIAEYTLANDSAAVKQGMWYHNRGVARYFRTYFLKDAQPSYIQQELNLALEDFQAACNSGNFGTAADGYAMIAQVLARLGKPMEEIQPHIENAFAADPKVFMVDVTNAEELSLPWPLPRHEYSFKKSPHDFVKVHFNKPTWCSHCMGFIKNPVGKQGYRCNACNYTVHSKCFPQVKAKSCWTRDHKELSAVLQVSGEVHSPSSSPESSPRSSTTTIATTNTPTATTTFTHNHHFKPTWFRKPTWCNYCSKFVVSPVGKQGYTCSDCGYKVHKDCASKVAGYIDG